MEIDTEKLKKIADLLFSYLENAEITKINFEKDYYWIIPKEVRYQIDQNPDKFTIGQLSEDFQFLLEMSEDKNTVGYGFVWLSRILRAIGEEVV